MSVNNAAFIRHNVPQNAVLLLNGTFTDEAAPVSREVYVVTLLSHPFNKLKTFRTTYILRVASRFGLTDTTAILHVPLTVYLCMRLNSVSSGNCIFSDEHLRIQ